jgi:acylphosphatase
MDDNVRVHVIITGRVQGVGFRYDIQRAAQRIGVCGWVRNRRDGSVEGVFEGEKERVKRMLDWCQHDAALARVDRVSLAWEPFSGEYTDFSIVR